MESRWAPETLCAVHMNGFPGRQSQVRTAAASLLFYGRARRSRDPFDHHHEQHFAAVPSSQPADSPTINAVTQGDGCTQTEIARLQSQLLNWTRRCGGQNGGLGSDIDGKVLGAHPDVDAGMMAGDRCIHVLWWSGKGTDFLAHVMTHYLGWARCARRFAMGSDPRPQDSRFKAAESASRAHNQRFRCCGAGAPSKTLQVMRLTVRHRTPYISGDSHACPCRSQLMYGPTFTETQ